MIYTHHKFYHKFYISMKKRIIIFFNSLRGFKKLKVKAVVGNYAIVVDQTDKFIGVADVKSVENRKEIWGKVIANLKVKQVSHASYKHNFTVMPVAPYNSTSNTWLAKKGDNELVVIEYYKETAVKTNIAANIEGFTQVPLLKII